MQRPATAHINRIATAVPPLDVHHAFLDFAEGQLKPRDALLFRRMAQRSGIEHRYSCLADPHAFYRRGDFPSTAARMAMFEREAPRLAEAAIERLGLGDERSRISHL